METIYFDVERFKEMYTDLFVIVREELLTKLLNKSERRQEKDMPYIDYHTHRDVSYAIFEHYKDKALVIITADGDRRIIFCVDKLYLTEGKVRHEGFLNEVQEMYIDRDKICRVIRKAMSL